MNPQHVCGIGNAPPWEQKPLWAAVDVSRPELPLGSQFITVVIVVMWNLCVRGSSSKLRAAGWRGADWRTAQGKVISAATIHVFNAKQKTFLNRDDALWSKRRREFDFCSRRHDGPHRMKTALTKMTFSGVIIWTGSSPDNRVNKAKLQQHKQKHEASLWVGTDTSIHVALWFLKLKHYAEKMVWIMATWLLKSADLSSAHITAFCPVTVKSTSVSLS